MNCHACGAGLSATARFCHKCGAQVGGGQASGWRAGLPWSVAGAALGALLTVLAFRLGGSSESGVRDAGALEDGPLPASRSTPPDISQMSPEERATRLYNRVMTLHTEGKADSAEFFLPMALQAYAMLRARGLELERDTAGARRAYRDFLKHEAAERKRRRPEYDEHAQNLDAFHEQATAATAGKTTRGG